MADIITEIEQYDETVLRLMINDPVKADDDSAPSEGNSNAAAKSLANRTKFLKARSGAWMNMYGAQLVLAGGGSVAPADAGKHILVTGSANCNVLLGGLSGFENGAILHISCFITGGKTCSIIADGAEVIQLQADEDTIQYMMVGEYMILMKNDTKWLVLDCSPQIYEAGQCLDGYVAGTGQLIRNGASLSRADYARLWRWVNQKLAATYSGSLVSETLWTSSTTVINSVVTGETVSPYKGFFSLGDGSTTFRVPDDRGMHTRYMDFGRGISNLILNNYPGGYGHDWLKKHQHDGVPLIKTLGDIDRGTLHSLFSIDDNGKTGETKLDNNSQGWQMENTVKASTKVPLIKV